MIFERSLTSLKKFQINETERKYYCVTVVMHRCLEKAAKARLKVNIKLMSCNSKFFQVNKNLIFPKGL